MVIALDPQRKWDYICTADKELEKDKQTSFKLQALTPPQLAEVTDSGMVHDRITGKIQYRNASAALLILSYGLVGWSNFKDSDGAEVAVPESALERAALVPEATRVELAQEIRFNAELTAEEGN